MNRVGELKNVTPTSRPTPISNALPDSTVVDVIRWKVADEMVCQLFSYITRDK